MKKLLVWTKRILLTLLILALLGALLSAYVRFQGVQYTVAFLGGGYAQPLPAVDAYPVTEQDGTNPCTSGPIKVITYNVFNGAALIEDLAERFADGDLQGFKPWSQRLDEIGERIAGYDADLIGLQEMGWNEDIADIVPPEAGYTLHSYKAGNFEYGDSALLFRSARFEMLDGGQMWLGPNPDLPMAYGYKRLSMLRYVNWAVLRERETGFTFLFANTHFDNASVNKEPASRLFRERITALAAGMPLVVTGDFNSPGETERYRVFSGLDVQPPILPNTQTLASSRVVHEAHGAGPRPLRDDDVTLNYLKRIDHILTGGPCPVTVTSWLIDARPMKDGDKISDHDLIAAELQFGAATLPVGPSDPQAGAPVAATP
ncbi:MAG: hypothetical protein RLZZ303_1717 [Candidatus Hydrogenedentota bacterium]